jgi:gamma-glutamylcyclotransferase
MPNLNNETHHLYFAYGSDMNDERMQQYCSKVTVRAVAKFPNYELAFFGHARKWDGAQDTLIQKPGEDLWGVVYELSFSEVDHLDVGQNVRMDGTGAYFHFPATVLDDMGNSYDVILYKKAVQGKSQLPSEEYLNYIVSGALSHHLPPEYITKLTKLGSKKATYAVPLKSKFDQVILLENACESCGE